MKRCVDDDIELQQAFMQVLFEKTYDNVDKRFSFPKSVKYAKQEYLDETDVVKQFIGDNLDITDSQTDRIKTSELYTTLRKKAKGKLGTRGYFKSLDIVGWKSLKHAVL